MDLKAATVIVRRHLASLLIMLLVFGGIGGGLLLKGYLALQDKWEQLDVRELKLKTRQVGLNEQEFLLNQREEIIKKREQNLAAQSKLLEQKESSTASKLARLQDQERDLSVRAERKRLEEHIQKLAADISDLGGVKDLPDCGDAEGKRRYDVAKSKLDELRALSNAGSQDAHLYVQKLDTMVTVFGDCESPTRNGQAQ